MRKIRAKYYAVNSHSAQPPMVVPTQLAVEADFFTDDRACRVANKGRIAAAGPFLPACMLARMNWAKSCSSVWALLWLGWEEASRRLCPPPDQAP